MIPEAAVEAAVRVHAEHGGETHWEDWEQDARAEAVAHMRAALEAAAPHMLAESDAKLAAVERLLDEKYKLWAAICGNTCSRDIVGVDHDAIADEIAAAIREVMRPTP